MISPLVVRTSRTVARVYIHCTASDIPLYGEELVEEIRRWHLARGFMDIGYHWVIDKAGAVMPGRSPEIIPAAQEGYNKGTFAVCVHGLKEFTPVSLASCQILCFRLWLLYDGALTYHGHCEVNPNKTCPVFDYVKLLNLDVDGRIKAPREFIVAAVRTADESAAAATGTASSSGETHEV